MIDINSLETGDFKKLPLVVEGESKEVRYAGEGLVVIKLKPTIYSYTHNRVGEIPGSDKLRMRAIQYLLPGIRSLGLSHTYIEVNDNWILSELVMQPGSVTSPAFLPDDLSTPEIEKLPKAPPIEVIAKARHTGTSKHRYYNFSVYPTQYGSYIDNEGLYPEPIIRFDWRNPMTHPQSGDRLADEILPEAMANWFIDTARATSTAKLAFNGLRDYFAARRLDLWDICFFISEDGAKLFGEISPDCMRVRTLGKQALDKDIWRAGGSSADILQKWEMLVDMLEAKVTYNRE